MRNPSAACPTSLIELADSINGDVKDPWGTDFIMRCGAALPPGARDIAISSAGPDRADGTDDDLRSWD